MTIYGYARFSTEGETLDAQLEALKAAGCTTIYQEKASGANTDRAQLAKLLVVIEAGDVLIVSRLDRLARSTRDLLNTLDTVVKRGAAFRSLGDRWADTTTPHGRSMLPVLGGLAEFERELLRTRTGEGRTRAEARGVPMGRPPKLTPHQRRDALQALASGTVSQAEQARRLNVSHSTMSRLVARAASTIPQPAKPIMDEATERAARVFLQKLEGRYPVQQALLYGSRARGTHRAESDADIAVILEGERGDRYDAVREMAGIAFDVMMETGVLVEALPLWVDELRRPESFSNPALIANIKRDGLRL